MKILYLLISILLPISSTLAEPSVRLSQLDFDNSFAPQSNPTQDPLLQEVFGDKSKNLLTTSKNDQRASLSMGEATSTEPVAKSKNINEEQTTYNPGIKFLKPASIGVDNEPTDSSLVRSSVGWDPTLKDSSQNCNKATAIKEVLNKYSGSDEFFNSQCTKSCSTSGEVSAIVSFEVSDSQGVASSISTENGVSYFQLRASEQLAAWPILEVTSEKCGCVPKSCLQ